MKRIYACALAMALGFTAFACRAQPAFPSSFLSAQPPAWIMAEQREYAALLAKEKADILVMPVQARAASIDRALRNYMSVTLASAIARSAQARVADVEWVDRALGAGRRTHNVAVAAAIAQSMQAKRIVWVSVGHDNGQLVASLWDLPLSPGAPASADAPRGAASMPWVVPGIHSTGLPPAVYAGNYPLAPPRDATQQPVKGASFLAPEPFGAQRSLVEAWDAALAQIVTRLQLPPAAPLRAVAQLEATPLPATPRELVGSLPSTAKTATTASANPARAAYTYLLLAQLMPEYAVHQQDWMLGKALAAATALRADQPDAKALRARAYMALRLRRDAMAVLGNPGNAEERGIAAVLAGNLPDARAALAQEKNPLKRVIAALDVQQIEKDYSLVTEESTARSAADLKLPGDIWPYLVWRRMGSENPWIEKSNISTKMILDLEFPVRGYDAETLVRGDMATRDNSRVRRTLDDAVVGHGPRAVAQLPVRCCTTAVPAPDAHDYLQLLLAVGRDNRYKALQLAGVNQGLSERAQQLAREAEPLLAGEAGFELVYAQVLHQEARRARTQERGPRRALARQRAVNAHALAQGQNRIASLAAPLAEESGDCCIRQPYAADVPIRPEGTPDAMFGTSLVEQARVQARLDAATSQLDTLHYAAVLAMTAGAPQWDAFVKENRSRFVGSTTLNDLVASDCARRSDLDCQIASLRANITLAPLQWDHYARLAEILIEQDKLEESAKIYKTYPLFTPNASGSTDRLSIGNHAHTAAVSLARLGRHDLARDFLEISVAARTGSSYVMAAETSLALQNEDIPAAIESAQSNVQRYSDGTAMRDYAAMLYASRQAGDAEAALGAFIRNSGANTRLVSAALVGQRMAGAAPAAVWNSAISDAFRTQDGGELSARLLLLRQLVVDRRPAAEPFALLSTVPAAPAAGGEVSDDMQGLRRFGLAYRSIVRGEDAPAAAGLRAIGVGNTQAAGISRVYFALVAGRAGNIAEFRKLPSAANGQRERFDAVLGEAVARAFEGDHDGALRQFKLAAVRRPDDVGEIIPGDFMLGDIAERVAAATGQQRYRTWALDWAHARARSWPWESWPHAAIARLSEQRDKRLVAIGMLQYLDPLSDTLARLPKADVEAGVAAARKRNLFRPVAGTKVRPQGT